MKILLHSTKPNLVWANICLTHTEWRERERGANPSSSDHKLDWQSDNDSTYPLPTAELVTLVVRGEWERQDDERLGEYGKTLPTIVLQQFWYHLYLSPGTHLTTALRTWWKVFLSCYYFIISQHLLLVWLLNIYTKRLQWSNHTRS